jgi:hypothetical protein
VGLEGLTSQKYVVLGDGHIRVWWINAFVASVERRRLRQEMS